MGTARPAIAQGMRLQWEAAQQAYVLLYPEGMVRVNSSAGAILSRCDGLRTADEIVTDLERTYNTTRLSDDVTGFLTFVLEKRWLGLRE